MRLLFLVFFFPFSLFGCALCTLYTPTAHTKLLFNAQDDTLKSITFQWTFSENFSKQLYDSYDLDGNTDFDAKELEAIQETLLSYIEPKRYLTELSFYDQPEGKSNPVTFQVESLDLHVKNKELIFTYDIPLFLPLKKGRVVVVRMEDNEGYFNFKLASEPSPLTKTLWIRPNINNQIGYFEMGMAPEQISDERPPLTSLVKETPQDKEETSSLPTQPTYFLLSSWLKELTQSIKDLLQASSKEGLSLAMINLLGISFLYGLIHAAGPGHGKTLIGSYFLAEGGRWSRAFLMALRIGIIHVAGAAALVALSKYGIEVFVGKLLSDTTLYTTRISAFVILLIAVYLFLKKIKKPSHHEHHCSCHSCGGTHTKSDWGMAFAAGIIPCPGTVVIFILTFTFGTYLSGFLSALAMALGMSSIIFLTSLLGQRIHISTQQHFSIFLVFMEYLSLVILAILGLLMLFQTPDLMA